ncbi:MAG: AAA family ATPase [Rhodobiaceae bacterium]|nr:AAA family ATPase [Rhodobiaceae bacterium]MCC0042032.1 AAA family ATPase [Rhodobiaceae bacterium]
MTQNDQSDVIAFLADPATHGGATQGRAAHGGTGPVGVIATHISQVFLAGGRAFKLKRAVTLPYADFSTPERRLAFCEKEFVLNRATAPGLYLGVRRITRTREAGLEFDGIGELADAVVEMVRFDQEALFDRLAVEGRLDAALMSELAGTIARFHADAPVVHAGSGSQRLAALIDMNSASFAESDVFSRDEVSALAGALRQRLARHAGVLDTREAAGRVRRCHGDLHLRNICLFEGRATVFDCIDFNDELASVDVLYDLAFLLMDLWHRGLGALASLVANRYFDAVQTDAVGTGAVAAGTGGLGTDAGFELLPFFMAMRAVVRAHVTATMARDGGADAHHHIAAARSYFQVAGDLLAPQPARIVAIGGFSGSGKSTLAEALAPRIGAPPGARCIESDRTRKAMFGVAASTRLGQDAYRAEVSREVYDRLEARASALAEAGASVVVNAVYDRADRRQRLGAAAAAAGVPFDGFWLAADPDALRRRVRERVGGPSDATLEVLEAQLSGDIDEMTWQTMPADGPLETTLEAILAATRPE